MAAVSFPPSPHTLGNMTNRRPPLASIPNAANSPYRAVAAAAAASKRLRAQSNGGDFTHGQAPPAKKQMLEVERSPAPRKSRTIGTQPTTAFERKLVEVKGKGTTSKPVKEQNTEETQETLRQWKQHYRKLFPTLVFYFESVPDDMRRSCSKQIAAFGAREEKFFSRDVTHVITTRTLPFEGEQAPIEKPKPLSMSTSTLNHSQPRTISPSLLSKDYDGRLDRLGKVAELRNGTQRGQFTFETSTNKPLSKMTRESDARKQHVSGTDILQKARDMNMRVWMVEKFRRIVYVMSTDGEEEVIAPQHGHNTRSLTTNIMAPKAKDLYQLMRNDQLNASVDRESSLGGNDLVPLKGPYVYIRCINEKTKPIMVRQYDRVQKREDGTWPQFRSATIGKCPFIVEDVQQHKGRQLEREMEKGRPAKGQGHGNIMDKILKDIPNPRAPKDIEAGQMRPPRQTGRKRSFAETEQVENTVALIAQCLPPTPIRRDSLNEGTQETQANQAHARFGFVGGEPMASGMQASNITSAIRSQMVSSTAAMPGAKAGTSKEIHGLQRKVLEKTSGPGLCEIAVPRSRAMVDLNVSRSGRSNAPFRIAKQRAQEKLVRGNLRQIHEDVTPSEKDEIERKSVLKRSNAVKALNGEQKEPKPGYCENCREKFEDFEEHTLSRKHRKFATTKENWAELDELLDQLVRPVRDHYS